MAEMKGNALGKISGTFGNLTARIRKGKNILSVKPSSYSRPMDENSINRRGKFKCDVLFSKTIVGLPDLKYFWESKITGDLSAFNLVMQTNYKLLKNGLPSSSNIIVPQLGFPITAESITLGASALDVTLAPLGSQNSFDPEIDKNFKFYSVIYLSAPVEAEMDPYSFISIQSEPAALQTAQAIAITITFNSSDAMLISKYATKHVFAAVATLNDSSIPQKYSITLYQ